MVASQTAIHREWGGVVPELASRQHVRDICGVVETALQQGEIARTTSRRLRSRRGQGSSARSSSACRSPKHSGGRAGSRWFRSTTSPATSNRWSSPMANCRCRPPCSSCRAVTPACISFPSPACTVYRPHTRRRGGEAYDKVAKLLGLGYPGGPVIDRLARQGTIVRGVSDSPADARRSQHAAANRRRPPARRGSTCRFQLQRAQDRGAPLVRERLGVAASKAAAAIDVSAALADAGCGGHLRQLPASGRRGAARSHVRGGAVAGRGASASPAASRPTAGSGRGRRARGAAGNPRVRAAARTLDRQCGDDRRRRIPPAGRRSPATLDFNAAASLDLNTWHRGTTSRTTDAWPPSPTTSGSTRHSARSSSASPTRSRRSSKSERRQGRHGARVGDAHHRRRLRERLGGRPDRRLPGLAREARARGPAVPASSDRRRQRRRAPEADADGPSGDRADHQRARSISDPGSRSSTPSSTGSAASGSSSRSWANRERGSSSPRISSTSSAGTSWRSIVRTLRRRAHSTTTRA